MAKALLIAALASLTLITSAPAQDYPNRPLTMLVPFPAGGPLDASGRVMAAGLADVLGKSVIVENVGGAGGMTGANRIAHAEPDGYHFLLGNTGTHAFVPTIYKKPPYDATSDFAPVGIFAEVFWVLVARNDLPVQTLGEFITYARANEANMHYGSAGAGSTTHIACLLLNAAMGTKIGHVPYRGAALAAQDLIGGRIDFMCDAIQTALPLIRSGNVKPIASLAPVRAAVLPEVATAQEQGLAGFGAFGWDAFFLPKGTPDAIVTRLNAAMVAALDTPAVRARIESLGLSVPAPARRSPEYLARLVPREIEKWAPGIRASGYSAE
jgi:tripartite-type tricarboxylate transporter receptor subunit TctC